jgi:hypothetical protein
MKERNQQELDIFEAIDLPKEPTREDLIQVLNILDHIRYELMEQVNNLEAQEHEKTAALRTGGVLGGTSMFHPDYHVPRQGK